MNILVTGASGYISSKWLQGKVAETSHIVPMEGRLPVVDPASLLSGIDVVLHLAALVQPKGDSNPSLYDHINHLWTASLGRECAKQGVRLLFPSASNVYSATGGVLCKEEGPYIAPQNAYAQSKYDAELALHALRNKGLRYCIFRIGSVFGVAPRISFDRVVNKFVQRASQGLPVTVWGNHTKNLHPYTHINDVSRVFDFVIEQDLFNGEVYNVVSQNATIGEVIENIRALYPLIEVEVTNQNGKFSFGMDDSKIRASGFSPTGDLKSGISEIASTL